MTTFVKCFFFFFVSFLSGSQCLVLEGLSTCAGDNGRTMMSCNIGTGGRIYNGTVSIRAPGQLLHVHMIFTIYV